MNCRRVRSVLSAYIDGELAGYEMLIVRDHLSHCRECRDEHYSLKTVKYLLSALPEKQSDPEWASFLSQSVMGPAPALLDRLKQQWSRSLDVLAPFLVMRRRVRGLPLAGQSIGLALAACAVGAVLLIAPLDRSKTGPSPRGSVQASIVTASPDPLLEQPDALAEDPGVTHFIAIPLPPGSFASDHPLVLSPEAAVNRMPVRNGGGNLRGLSSEPGLSGFAVTWPSQRLPDAPGNRIAPEPGSSLRIGR